MSKQMLIIAGIVLVLLAVGYDTVTQFQHSEDNRRRIEQVCDLGKRLAVINKKHVQRQDAQTQALLGKGVTFGIPKIELPRLLQESKENAYEDQSEYDAIAKANCEKPNQGVPHARNVPRKTHQKQRDKAVLGNQRVLRFHRFGGDSGSGLASHP